MITFITGDPGTGKTLFTLHRVEKDWGEEIANGERQIFYCGINDLKIPGWKEISYEDVERWYEYPKGSIFLIDEIQKIWPGKNRGGSATEGIKKLDTHRHGGYDFYIITQKPTNAHDQMRGYVGEHYHYDRLGGLESAREFFFNRAVDNPMTFPDKDDAVSVTRRQYPKQYYDKYKSADMHYIKKKMPKKLYVYGFALLATIFGGGLFAYDLSTRDEQQQFNSYQYEPIPTHQSGSFSRSKAPTSTSEYVRMWTPRIENIPHSAPAYDEVAVVKTFPRPQCLYRHKNRVCKCYTQQATPLSIDFEMCMSIVKGGYFNPFHDEEDERERGQESGQALAAAPAPDPTQEPVVTLDNPKPKPTGPYWPSG